LETRWILTSFLWILWWTILCTSRKTGKFMRFIIISRLSMTRKKDKGSTKSNLN
jgi:hypothetical protein